MTDAVVICAGKRTPIGRFRGRLRDHPATGLGSSVLAALLADTGLAAGEVDDVLMGCVLPAGLGQAPARQSALGAGMPSSVPATTINKVCGSGMKAVMMAADSITASGDGIILAGGMENMTRAPHLADKPADGGAVAANDMRGHMFFDGLRDAYGEGHAMGHFAERTAEKYGFSRADQDDFALSSLSRARNARPLLEAEITSLMADMSLGPAEDEGPRIADPAKIPRLQPAFSPDGTVTAANSSSLSDGAAALMIANESRANALGLPVRARIVAHAGHAHAPEWFTIAPVMAVRRLLDRIGWQVGDVDLWEINEAFAVVALAFMRETGVPHDRLNVHGGACALGHPIGATGARVIVTLLHALEARGLSRGIAGVCIGGGEASAIAIERPSG